VIQTGAGERHVVWLEVGGGTRAYDVTLEPLRDAAGDVDGITGAAVDVTERVEADLERDALRKALEDSEARFRGLATSNVIGILACDPETVIDANDAFLNLIGYTRQELLAGAIRWRTLTPPEYAERDEQGLDELVRTGTCRPFAKEYVRRDGTRVPVLLGATVVSRDPFEWVCFVIDATAQRRAEEQLRQAQKLEAVGQLAGGVAHEVNNMMAAVIGFGEFVQKRLGPNHPSTPDVDEMVRAANRAAGVTRQLLAFSRRQLMQPDVLDLSAVVQALQSLIGRLLGADRQLRLAAAPDVGPVLVDRGQLEQVIVNLALNARDAMRSGGTLTLATSEVLLGDDTVRERGVAVRPGRYAQLTVTDDGSGMDDETRRRAFEPFFTTKPVGQGTGLGLPTVYGIVKQSGGYVWIDSAPGRGTTVTVQLPVNRRAAAVGTPVSSTGAADGQETILIVEDEGLVRRMAARALEEHGYTVLEAEHGRDAQELLGRPDVRVDAVITDLVMPELNGNELGRWLRARYPELPVLYTSGYTDSDVLERGLLEASAPFLQKPFTPDALARHVREMLDAARPHPA
jgi:PAS domain S-box-containing protein